MSNNFITNSSFAKTKSPLPAFRLSLGIDLPEGMWQLNHARVLYPYQYSSFQMVHEGMGMACRSFLEKLLTNMLKLWQLTAWHRQHQERMKTCHQRALSWREQKGFLILFFTPKFQASWLEPTPGYFTELRVPWTVMLCWRSAGWASECTFMFDEEWWIIPARLEAFSSDVWELYFWFAV